MKHCIGAALLDGSAYSLSRPTISKEIFAAAIKAAKENNKLAVAHISTAKGARLAIELGVNGLVHLFADQEVSDELIALANTKGVFIVPTASIDSNASGSNLTTGGVMSFTSTNNHSA